MAGNAGKHHGADFDGIVKCKHKIRIPVSEENTV